MQFILPEIFEKILNKNNKLKSALYKALSVSHDLALDNSLEFFPEFTDHGVEHIQSVIDKSANLISSESIVSITPEDVYVLVCAALLHDSAMHLTKQSLWSLIEAAKFSRPILGMSQSKSWAEKWDEFTTKVNRFDQANWESLFGEFVHVSVPKIGEENLTDFQKILIGDFVRHHHADLAQMIAVHGFPAKDGGIEILSDEFRHLNQLAGFVARSHNYSLREMKDILGEPSCIATANCHPTYLMGLLRIADYLQFENKRTPKVMFRLKGISSPRSIREWNKQISIINTHTAHRDKELLYVEAFPNDSITLRDVKYLLAGLQKELDELWAVLGEVYSRDEALHKLGITIRRVRSNIDDGKDYIARSHQSFYPDVLSLRTDDQRVYPLLIKPLYGNQPQIGLRELLQNSVDACRERYSVETKKDVTFQQIPYDVNITLDFINEVIVIKDRGVGMNVDIVNEFFLRIGASYRYSEEWKSLHSHNDGVFVPRTGKFGVGMLAGFLLGDRIDVVTRSYKDEMAISFSYNLKSKDIEVKYIDNTEVGTTITITSDKSTLNQIEKGLGDGFSKYGGRWSHKESSWWYFLDNPQINTTVLKSEGGRSIEQKAPALIEVESIAKKWSVVSDTELTHLFWRWGESRGSLIFCNGVIIKEQRLPNLRMDCGFESALINDIDLLVFDNDGIFPLNLQRSHIVGDEFFEIDKIKNSIYENVAIHFYQIIKDEDNVVDIANDMHLYLGVAVRQVLPFMFKSNEIQVISQNILNGTRLFIDFIYPSVGRGVVFTDAMKYIGDLPYICSIGIDKSADSVRWAIKRFVLFNKGTSYYSFTLDDLDEKEKLSVSGNGWLAVRKYDWDKLGDINTSVLDQFKLRVTQVDNEWMLVTANSNNKPIPSEIYNLASNVRSKEFMFAIVDINGVDDIEFYDYWNKLGFPHTVNKPELFEARRSQ